MTTRRKIPAARVPMTDKNGIVEREWYSLLEREQYVGVPETSATAGAASALPATPEGYATFTLNGVQYLMPYYKQP